MADSIVSRMKTLIGGRRERQSLSPRLLAQLRQQLSECAAGTGGEVSVRNRAAKLGETYLGLDDAGRHEFLRRIALDFGPDPAKVDAAHRAYQTAVGTPGQWDAEADLRGALRSSRIRILTQFNALPQGVKFLVDLRADLLRFLDKDEELAVLDRELESRLTAWFDVGFLELSRITWNSPASLLEKLIQYEAVHEIRSWNDLRNRLDSDRRLYAFFHPRMPQEPLIFVEVALTPEMPGAINTILSEKRKLVDPHKANCAIFYSISNCQKGLLGIPFGNFLIKRVAGLLSDELPQLKTFATLSPVPGFARWLSGELGEGAKLPGDRQLRTLAAKYLVNGRKKKGTVLDSVARFHLGNGARLEAIHTGADMSPNGLRQSHGVMVNYVYDMAQIEANHIALFELDTVPASKAVMSLLETDKPKPEKPSKQAA